MSPTLNRDNQLLFTRCTHGYDGNTNGNTNGCMINLYVEHYGYDVIGWLSEPIVEDGSDDDSDIEVEDDVKSFVELHNEGEDDVNIPNKTIHDPFLTRLCDGTFISGFDENVVYDPVDPHRTDEALHDVLEEEVDDEYKIKTTDTYPIFNPHQHWKDMQPILGMRFESPEQLKQCLISYGVAHGYQLWYEKNEHNGLLVRCGRSVDLGRCASRDRKRKRKEKLLREQAEAEQVEVGAVEEEAAEAEQVEVGQVEEEEAEVEQEEEEVGVAEHKEEVEAEQEEEEEVEAEQLTEGVEAEQAEVGQDVKGKQKCTPEKGNNKVCPFRLWASWMSNERSFQIKSLIPTHACVRNFDLSPLVNFKWVAKQYANDIIQNPKLTCSTMRSDIKKHFLINVSYGMCKRAKHRAIFDHEGGLREHYARLRDYKDAILSSNPGSSVKLEVDEKGNGEQYFRRMYICFKGIKDGWVGNCRRVIGLDGCFLKSTVKGELLTAMGRDANNQMYPIAWGVVNVENKDNWCWFLASLCDDLNLCSGSNLTVISDGHKGLIEAVATWLPNAEHRQCTRHVYANFKKKWSGVHYRRLFWSAASSTVVSHFEAKMEEIKKLDEAAYKYLLERNPNSWCRAFFAMDRSCAAYENGISESYHKAILDARHKPIITMLEDIRVYLMQRLYTMSLKARSLDDELCPSVRKYLERMKVQQR